MQRIIRFWRNVGILGGLVATLISSLIVITMWGEIQTGGWVYTLPVLLGAVLLGFLVRNFLFEHFPMSGSVLHVNSILIAVLASISAEFADLDALWLRLTFYAVVGCHLSSLFFLMSDERLVAVR